MQDGEHVGTGLANRHDHNLIAMHLSPAINIWLSPEQTFRLSPTGNLPPTSPLKKRRGDADHHRYNVWQRPRGEHSHNALFFANPKAYVHASARTATADGVSGYPQGI